MGVRLIVASTARDARQGADASATAETTWEFAQPRIVLGRAASADVVLPHPSASTRHATIEADGPRYTIVDHSSLNGTWVNGQRLVPERKKPLRDGDRIDVGLFSLRFVSNVPTNDVPSRERTSVLALRLLRQVRGGEAAAPARLTITHGPDVGRVTELPAAPARLVLGRGESCELVLADGDASREHAELVVDAEGVLVRDLASKNGIFVGETKVAERRLRDRDELRIGATTLVYEAAAEPSLRAIESLPDAPSAPPAAPSSPPPAATEPPAPSPVVEPAPAPAEHDEPAIAPPRASHPAPRGPRLAPAEVAVYAVALVVFALSAAGLWWLLDAS